MSRCNKKELEDGSSEMEELLMKFEDLESWQKARGMVAKIYTLTRKKPLATDFALASQIQRAAVSVMSNIAEGFERIHIAEKLQAYNIARGSCGEVRSLLYVIEDNYQADPEILASSKTSIAELGRLISGLIASTERRR